MTADGRLTCSKDNHLYALPVVPCLCGQRLIGSREASEETVRHLTMLLTVVVEERERHRVRADNPIQKGVCACPFCTGDPR